MKSLSLRPRGAQRVVQPKKLPDLKTLEQCTQLTKLKLIAFKYPQPWHVDILKLLPLETLIMEGGHPIAAAMPFLLAIVTHLNGLKVIITESYLVCASGLLLISSLKSYFFGLDSCSLLWHTFQVPRLLLGSHGVVLLYQFTSVHQAYAVLKMTYSQAHNQADPS